MTLVRRVCPLGLIRSGFRKCSLPGLLLAAILGLALFSQPAFAQAETGVVTGRVLNATNGMYLPRAVVAVDGTSMEVLTDDSGSYTLRGVPAGERVITARFTGQEPVAVTVNVPAGGSVDKQIVFNRPPDRGEDDEVILQPYVVQENRFKNAQEIATNEERYSVNIKNVISADAFGDIPSGNVGEFVKFMPGVLVEYGGVGGANQGVADSDVTGVSVRGFEAADTSITIDGMPVTNAFPGSLSRQTYLDTMSINNASRVELIKVPTPDMPANSAGGQINLITRSAFEYAKPSFNWSLYATANKDFLTLSKTPGPINESTRKVQPAGTLSVTYPLTPNFGFTVSGSWVPQFKSNKRAQMSTYTRTTPSNSTLAALSPEDAGEAIAASWRATNRLERYQITDTPQFTTRTSGNLKVDWKPFPGHTLTANVQASTYDSEEAARRLDYRTGTATFYDATTVIGQRAHNNPRVAMTVTTRDRIGDNLGGYLTYKLQLGGWNLEAVANSSVSNSEYQDRKNGHFSEVNAILGGATSQQVQVNFKDMYDGVPRYIEVIGGGGAGAQIDSTQLTNWRYDGTVVAKSGEAFSKDTVDLYKVDLKRDLDFFPGSDLLNMSAKVGWRRDTKEVKKWGIGSGYGEELMTGKSVSFADLRDDTYLGQKMGFNHPAQEWISSYKLFELDQQQDLFDVVSEGQKISNWNSYVNQNKAIKETKDAIYFQLEGSLFNGRFNWVGGMRQEEQTRKGFGPYTDNRWNYVKNADGTVYREGNVGDPLYNGVRFSAANDPLFTDPSIRSRLDAQGLWYPKNPDGTPRVLTNSVLEGRMLQLQPMRPVDQKSKGDPSYSLSGAYEVTKNLVARLAWSRTFRQPPLENTGSADSGLLSGNNQFQFTEFTEIDANGMIGQIQMANLALDPETSNNWDASLSYYFNSGGKVTFSYYWKEVTNQIITFTTYPSSPIFDVVLESAGFDPEDYRRYYLRTASNGDGSQKTDGVELEVQQNFGVFGGWGKYFNAFASYTKKSLGDPQPIKPVTVTRPDGVEVVITPASTRAINRTANEFAGAGINFSSKRVSITLRGTYRSRNQDPQTAVTTIAYTPTGGTSTILNYLRGYEPSETRIDASIDYKLTERLSLFATGKDIFNATRGIYYEDDLGWLPSSGRWKEHKSFGVEVTFGVRGTF